MEIPIDVIMIMLYDMNDDLIEQILCLDNSHDFSNNFNIINMNYLIYYY